MAGDGKLNVFNLGERGVVLTKDPIHTVDGEVIQAQNAISSPESGLGGLESRPGMSRVNSGAMAGGAVQGFVALPFKDPGNLPLSIYAAVNQVADTAVAVSYDDGVTWRQFASGSTDPWVTGGALTYWAKTKTGGFTLPLPHRSVTLEGRILYAGNDYFQYPDVAHSPPVIRAYDGVQPSEMGRVPYSPTAGAGTNCRGILCFGVHDATIYLGVWDTGADGAGNCLGPNVGGRVFSLDTATGVLIQIGNSFGAAAGENAGGVPVCLTSHGGLLWAGTFDQTAGGTGKIWRIRPGVDDTWTLDHTTSASKGYIIDLVSYRGELFACTLGEAGTASVVKRRTTAGVWSDSDTNTSTAANNGFGSPIVYQGNLYVWMVGGTASAVSLIRKFDGTTWSTDADLNSLFAALTGSILVVVPGAALELHDDIFIAHADGVLRRHLGSWSRALDLSGLLFHGDLMWTNQEYT
jgi:hypothetical protein